MLSIPPVPDLLWAGDIRSPARKLSDKDWVDEGDEGAKLQPYVSRTPRLPVIRFTKAGADDQRLTMRNLASLPY